MKPLALLPQDPNRFAVLNVAALADAWANGFPANLQQCHKEGLTCGPRLGHPPFHEPDCAYTNVAWKSADQIARQIVAAPPLRPDGLLDVDAVQAEALDLAGHRDLGRAATSLLTDAVALPPAGGFSNGRHRVAAFADQGLIDIIGITGAL